MPIRWEAEVGNFQVQSQPGIASKTVSERERERDLAYFKFAT